MAHEPDGAVQHTDEIRPCPGHQVMASCDLPAGTHEKTVVRSGTGGEIVRTPAYFCTTYSIRFRVHDRLVTLHGIKRHEFRIVGRAGSPAGTGVPTQPPLPATPSGPRGPAGTADSARLIKRTEITAPAAATARTRGWTGTPQTASRG